MTIPDDWKRKAIANSQTVNEGRHTCHICKQEFADGYAARDHVCFADVLDFLASEKCDGACLYWQMPNPFRGRDAAAAGVVREVDDLLVHPDATEIEAGMSYTMEKKT